MRDIQSFFACFPELSLYLFFPVELCPFPFLLPVVHIPLPFPRNFSCAVMHSFLLSFPKSKTLGPSIQSVVKAASQRSTTCKKVMTNYSPLQSISYHHLLWNAARVTPHFSSLTTELKEPGVKVDLSKFPAGWRITGTYSPIKRIVFLSNLFPLHIVTQVLKFCVSCSSFSLLIKDGLSEVSNSLSITPRQVCLGNFLHVRMEDQTPYSQANITTAIMGPKFSSRFTGFLLKWKSLCKSINEVAFEMFSV